MSYRRVREENIKPEYLRLKQGNEPKSELARDLAEYRDMRA